MCAIRVHCRYTQIVGVHFRVHQNKRPGWVNIQGVLTTTDLYERRGHGFKRFYHRSEFFGAVLMATIQKVDRKRGKKYRVFIRRKGQKPISKVFDRKKAAEDWARLMDGSLDQIAAYPDAEARRRTVGEAIDGFMLDYAGKDTAIVGRMFWWKNEYGAVPLASFTQATVKEGIRKLGRQDAKRVAGKGKECSLGRKRSTATLNRYLAAISIAMTWAVDQDWIGRNPAAGIRRKKESRGVVRWLDDNEREQLLGACDASEWSDLGLLVRLALSTGARLGELLKLSWSDLDLKKGVAHIADSKSGEPRVLPLVRPVREMLGNKARPIDGALVFGSPNDPTRPFAFRRHWNSALKEADIEKFRFHDLRHTAASYLAMHGASHLEIADVLGHKTLVMVKRYSHLATDHKQELVESVFSEMVN